MQGAAPRIGGAAEVGERGLFVEDERVVRREARPGRRVGEQGIDPATPGV